MFIQRLSENIKELIISGNIHQLNVHFLKIIPYEMMSDLYIFSSRVRDGILSNENRTCVVKPNLGVENLESIVQKLIMNPKNLSTSYTNDNILTFSG